MTTHRSDDPWGGLLSLVRALRSPDGCPWDREQTVASLAPYLVEEAYEVLHAVEERADGKICEEAGDLAFVLSLFLLTAEQEGRGTLADTLADTVAKIRLRHPHVFPRSRTTPPGQSPPQAGAGSRRLQLEWERVKQAELPPEEQLHGESPGHLAGVPTDLLGPEARESVGDDAKGRHRLPPPHPALPALAQAAKLQDKAANLGFDWPEVDPVFGKVREELAELEQARSSGTAKEIQEELGDLLFAVVNLARFLGFDPESSLRRANQKFRRRFHDMLALMESEGRDPERSSLAEMDLYWERAKRQAGTGGT